MMLTRLSVYLTILGMVALTTGCEERVHVAPDETAVDTLQISGSLLYRERVMLPEGSTATVSVHAAGPDRDAVAQTTFASSGQVPLDFFLAVPSSDIDSLTSYELTATLVAEGTGMRWATPEPIPVLEQGRSTSGLEVILYAAEPGPEEISDEPWRRARERGVSFRAVGQEPGWIADIYGSRDRPERIHLQLHYGEVEHSFGDVVREFDGDGHPRYRASEGDHHLELMLEDRVCYDTMSGEQFEAVVIVRIDDETFTGCGRSLS